MHRSKSFAIRSPLARADEWREFITLASIADMSEPRRTSFVRPVRRSRARRPERLGVLSVTFVHLKNHDSSDATAVSHEFTAGSCTCQRCVMPLRMDASGLASARKQQRMPRGPPPHSKTAQSGSDGFLFR
jgi:hypothetical protein